MKKKLLFLAIAALLTALLCVSALASSDSPSLYVGGVEVTASGEVTGTGITDGTVSYDADTNTLTLNGATLSGYYEDYAYPVFIYAENDLNIVLIGDNKVEYGDNAEYPRVIDVGGDLTISGNGSLTCGDSENDAFAGSGIECSGNLKVENATLNFYVENDGIDCWDGNVELNNATIDIISTYTDCINGNDVKISGGNVSLQSKATTGLEYYGIRGDEVLICDGANIEIEAYVGCIDAYEALKVTGATTNFSARALASHSSNFCAINVPYVDVNGTIYPGVLDELVVESGVVKDFTVFETPTEVYVNGVNLLEKEDGVPGAVYDPDTSTLTLTNVDLSVSNEYEAVIYANGDLNIVLVGENKVTANGPYVGIWISGSLFISGDSLTVISNNSKAISVYDNACIASGKLIAAGYTEGIDIVGDLYVLEGVEIEAISEEKFGLETATDLIVYGGKITAVNESGSTAMDIGENMEVYGGSIIATNKSGGRALDIDDDLLVYGGSIVATGENYGIDVADDFNIEGGSVSATATGTDGAALRIAKDIDHIRTIGANGALTLNAATPVLNDGSSPWLQENNGKLTVYVDSVEEIDQFLDAGGTLGFVLRQDITGTVTIPAGADVTISGGNEKHTLTGQIKCTVDTDNTKTTKLTLDGLTLNGGGSTRMAVISQEQNKETVSGLELSMNGCTVENYTDKAVYLTNATALSIDGCTFTNNATGDMDKPNTKGDYTIDLNLVSVAADELSITNSSFSGTCGDKAVIKVAARGGDSDAGASDISGSAATVEKLTVSGCTFSAEDSAADLNIGTDNKSYDGTGDIPANSTGSFAVSVSGNTTEVKINEAFKTYKNEDGNYIDTDTNVEAVNTVVKVGESAEKTEDGSVEVTPDEPDEPDEPDIPDLPVIPDIPVVTPPASDDEPDDVQPAENPYTDVAEGAWYYDVVMQAGEAGLMKGVTDTEFEPNGTLTRAMFWTILARAGGVDTDGGATWYAKAQAWATENGVSDGTDAMGAITREQLVTMLWRLNGEPVVDYLLTAPDAAQISPWALEAMRWAASIGLIEGDETGALSPAADTTRAQAAAFMVRYLTVE